MTATPYPYVGPIAAYNNVPINAQWYKPSQYFISELTLGITTIVTTSVNHNYVIGQECRLIIPILFGCRQLNGLTGFVIQIPAPNQVILNIDSFGGNPFIPNPTLPTYAKSLPQILAIGDINSGAINSNGPANTSPLIPGSFEDISPL